MKLSFADSPSPRMFSQASSPTTISPTIMSSGLWLSPCEPGKCAQVVRHEERRDGDREDVVQRQRPAGEERDDVIEGMAGERGRPARFGEHRRALGIGFRGQREQAAGEDEHQRRQPERMGGDEAERVVDRGADVAVGGGEQAGDAHRLAQAVL